MIKNLANNVNFTNKKPMFKSGNFTENCHFKVSLSALYLTEKQFHYFRKLFGEAVYI